MKKKDVDEAMKNDNRKDSLKSETALEESSFAKGNGINRKCLCKTFMPCSIGFVLLNILLWGLSFLSVMLIIFVCCDIIDMGTTFDYSSCIVVALAGIYLFYLSINFSFGFIIHLRDEDVFTHGIFIRNL